MIGRIGAHRFGIRGRVVLSMALVILAGGVTALITAALLGPPIFERHIEQIQNEPGDVLDHASLALRSATSLTLALSLVVSAVTSLIVGLALARKFAAPLAAMSRAAEQVAGGQLETSVTPPRIGAEFDALARSFNTMARQLEENEGLRRRLMADVAHELRTPVATIAATIDAVEDGVQEFSPQTVSVLRAQASRLSTLADDLASLTRAESSALVLDLHPCRPEDLLARAGEACQVRFARADVGLAIEVEPHLPLIQVDPDRIGQVLAGLLDNALRHTDAGGQVTLAANAHDDRVRLIVLDTGEGIEAEHLPLVFERFYRVDTARDRARGGSGIGLSIARALVQAHDGAISVHSAGRGRGTRFIIELPAAPAS